MRHRFPVLRTAAVLLLMCLLLSGCELTDTLLQDVQGGDGLRQTLLTDISGTIAASDPDAFFDMTYPGAFTAEEAADTYRTLCEAFPDGIPEDAKLTSLRIQSGPVNGIHSTRTEIGYRFPAENGRHILEITHLKSGENAGIIGVRFKTVSTLQGAFPVFARIWDILIIAGLLWGIIDILRIKPPRFGWYIVLVLLSFTLSFDSYKLAIPLGLIIYLAKRRSLKEKAALRQN